MRLGERVVRHSQADVVVVAAGLGVVGPADGQHVVLGGGIYREIVVADRPPVSVCRITGLM